MRREHEGSCEMLVKFILFSFPLDHWVLPLCVYHALGAHTGMTANLQPILSNESPTVSTGAAPLDESYMEPCVFLTFLREKQFREQGEICYSLLVLLPF